MDIQFENSIEKIFYKKTFTIKQPNFTHLKNFHKIKIY